MDSIYKINYKSLDMTSKKIKFKSKAELWFPTVIWETELDNNSKENVK